MNLTVEEQTLLKSLESSSRAIAQMALRNQLSQNLSRELTELCNRLLSKLEDMTDTQFALELEAISEEDFDYE